MSGGGGPHVTHVDPFLIAAARRVISELDSSRGSERALVATNSLGGSALLRPSRGATRSRSDADSAASGDLCSEWTCYLAFQLARDLGVQPGELARRLAAEAQTRLPKAPQGSWIESIESTPAGFINLRVYQEALATRCLAIAERASPEEVSSARSASARSSRVVVSWHPFAGTTPVPAHAATLDALLRLSVCSALATLLGSMGWQVRRECFIADAVTERADLALGGEERRRVGEYQRRAEDFYRALGVSCDIFFWDPRSLRGGERNLHLAYERHKLRRGFQRSISVLHGRSPEGLLEVQRCLSRSGHDGYLVEWVLLDPADSVDAASQRSRAPGATSGLSAEERRFELLLASAGRANRGPALEPPWQPRPSSWQSQSTPLQRIREVLARLAALARAHPTQRRSQLALLPPDTPVGVRSLAQFARVFHSYPFYLEEAFTKRNPGLLAAFADEFAVWLSDAFGFDPESVSQSTSDRRSTRGPPELESGLAEASRRILMEAISRIGFPLPHGG